MDRNRIEAASKQVSGAIKEAVGKVTGDSKLQAEGAAEKAAGKTQAGAAAAADGVRDRLL